MREALVVTDVQVSGSRAIPPARNYEPASTWETFIVPLLRQRIEWALSTFASAPPEGGRVLDVGCGRQPFRAHLESLGYHYVGLDVQQNPEGTVAFQAPIDDPVPFGLGELGPFHLILCTEVLEHVADWATAFANFADLLAPKGLLLITCPHYYMLHEEPFDFWRPTLHALRHFSEGHGLRVLHAEAAGSPGDVLGTLLGGCQIRPRTSRYSHRLVARLANTLRRAAIRSLLGGWLRHHVVFRGPTYLSNVVVVERS